MDANEQELRELLREAEALIDSMATWFRNQPLGCPPAGTAQWQSKTRRVLAAGVTASAKPCGAVCRAGQQDGIGCAPDECDRENGTRPLARKDLVMLNAADLSNALRRAFNLGQTYWQQADSESWKQQAKANETQGKFAALVEETVAALGVTEGASAGWKLVPVELTQPMREAWDIAPNGEDDDENMRAGYRAMLAAAPSPAGVAVDRHQTFCTQTPMGRKDEP